ncbi:MULTISPECIES: hypothetical protein [Streptomyces]|uniref:Uncharacterized protein n=1 Tax=Streptomyces bobili TaxID=67280 RepID=A0ABZ1QXY8_9ACTN|nr:MULTISPECIES: hypothetical protein [Streptomyces]MCX5526104.1 hypothetical protein [Streptomyces bobili]MDX3568781.1 hypothetical protein [Streptomyces sp. ID05-47C]QEU67728.1 hypothetical protein CP966_22675 [Streptomyces galilaeus]GGW31182.1 hypothetical protein GCM10010350_13290 [Streptomyces galilaeus]
MSLVDLIARADERGLAASGLACLDRCVPLLGGDDEILRPLWGNLTEASDAADWGGILDQIRAKLGEGDGEDDGGDEAVLLARRMLAGAPAERTAAQVRLWADACSVASLQIHRLLDPADDPSTLDDRREGRTQDMPPLAAAELRRQVTVLEVVAGHGAGGLRRALEVSVEGRRVLRAVVSRRARGRK